MFEMSEVSDHMMQTGGLLVSSISLMAVVNTKDANMSWLIEYTLEKEKKIELINLLAEVMKSCTVCLGHSCS